MISVIVEWNTDDNSGWVNEEDRIPIPGEEYLDYPLSIIGPFADSEAAVEWMQTALEDNTDVLDMYVLERDYSEDWFIANPEDYPDGYYRFGRSDGIVGVIHEPPMPIEHPGKVSEAPEPTRWQKFKRAFPIRKLSRGVEIWYAHRISFTRNWRNKPYPYWFKQTYDDGTFTWQSMWFEYWYRPHMKRSA